MNIKRGRWFLVVMTLLWPGIAAQAAITCTVSSPGFATSYANNSPSPAVVQSYVTVTCQRNDNLNDPTTQAFGIRANNGMYPGDGGGGGAANSAKLAGQNRYIRYELYSDGACSSLWSNNSTRITGSVSLSGLVPSSVNISYWGCVPAGQNARAGIYSDNVTMTLYQGATNTVFDTGLLPVAVHGRATCTISSAPAPMTFNYTSFGPAANTSTTFGATCTDQLPYTLSLDSSSGTLLGLDYSLSLSASSVTGNGVQQTHTISGTMAAGQAGTCTTGSCSATQTHTLIITY